MNQPSELDDDHWIWRWQYCGTDEYEYLHRIADPFAVGRKAAWKAHRAQSVCGISDLFKVPGLPSRLGALRCPQCCQLLRIPSGRGAPWNHQGEQWRGE